VVDYTELTKKSPVKKEVEIHITQPSDIDSFLIKNPNSIRIGAIKFNKNSFVNETNDSQTQCECVSFSISTLKTKSWILFIELKYCEYKNAIKNLNKAKEQVFATKEYFKSKGIIEHGQLCYLIISLPKQNNTPFEGWIMTDEEAQRLRKEEKVIFKGVNEITIHNETRLKI
jgi:hypothetical protein